MKPVEASITHVWEAIYANASTAVIAYVTVPTNKEPRSCLRGTLRAQKRIILAIVKLMSHQVKTLRNAKKGSLASANPEF